MSATSRLRDARQRLDARRSTHPQVDTALQLIELQDESGGGLLAAAIAFRFFLFIIPFVFVVVMGLRVGAEAAGADIKGVARRAGITGVAAAAVESGASGSSTARWTTLLIALIALVRGARNLIRALWVAHALIWRVSIWLLASAKLFPARPAVTWRDVWPGRLCSGPGLSRSSS